MKIINKFILSNLIKLLFVTMILTTLILLSVDLFSNLNSYVQNNVSWDIIFNITIDYIPQAIMIVLAPTSLFCVTFFLSQLYANNEVIALLSSGLSLRNIYKKILLLMACITFIAFLFNENYVLESITRRTQFKNQIFNINYNLNNSNIGLLDSVNNNIIYANTYIEKDKTLFGVIVVQKNEDNEIIKRIDSKKAIWNSENKDWILQDVIISDIKEDNIEITMLDEVEDPNINLEPNLFRSITYDLQTMFFTSAIKYLNIQKKVNIRLWYQNMSEFLERLTAPFSAFFMVIIACSIDYRNKKNVFLFSIFNSIVIAVIFYVSKMLFQLTAKQAILSPYISITLPYVIILFIPLILNKLKSFSAT